MLLIFSIFSFNLLAQSTVTETVRFGNGTELTLVSFRVKGCATLGTSINELGYYSLNLTEGENALSVSSVGYLTQDFSVNNKALVDIVMATNNTELDAIVFRYSTLQKKDITNSVSLLSIKSIKSVPICSALDALQSQASDVNVITSGML